MNLKIKTGFTLIEIIVCLIILGVLAALSMSSYYQWIKRSLAAEVLLTVKEYHDRTYACIQLKLAGDLSSCFAAGTYPTSAHFTYSPSMINYSNPASITWSIEIDPIAGASSIDPTSFMTITYNSSGTAVQSCFTWKDMNNTFCPAS